MAARAPAFENRWEGAARRILRPGVLLFVIALHAALLVLASRWQMPIDLHREESLIFLPLLSSVKEPVETPPPPEATHKKPASTRELQVVIVPKEVPPAPPIEATPPPSDWNAEAALTARHQTEAAARPGPRSLDQHGGGLDFDGGLGPDADAKPEFGWYHARTHRIEALEGGGSILWLNDRCFIVMAGLIPFPMCGIGKIPPRGDLFDHMRDSAPHDHPNAVP
jgi:hypothetical protein